MRQDGRLCRVSHLKGWTSPRLGIRFALSGETLEIFGPRGQPFLTSVELAARLRRAAERAEQEAAHADQEQRRAEREHKRAEREHERAELLAARLRALGIDEP